MSHWDFSRRPEAEHDAPPSGPDGTAYEPDLMLGTDDAWAAREVPRSSGGAPGLRPDGDGTPQAPWPAGNPWPTAGQWPPGDAWDDDEGTAPYPITYERDDFLAAAPEPAPPPAAPWEPWPPDSGLPGEAPAGWDGAGWDGAEGGWDEDGRRYAGRGWRRWLVLAGVVAAAAAVGAAAVLLAGRGPAGRGGAAGATAAPSATPDAQATAAPSSSATAAAPLALAQAQAVVATYTTVNNSANAQRSDALLATIETGSSYAIDAGVYQSRQGRAPYPAFAPARATYYIPRGEPAAGPRWFVVQVGNAFSSDPDKVTSSEYLLFTQQAPGGPWQDAAEPYLLSGGGAPRIAVGADGLATAVGPDAPSVAVAPARLPAATAASVDGTAARAGQAAVAVPGNLADVSDQRFWQGKLPGGKVTDGHSPAAGTAGQEFALRTADGGALVFYTDAAQLTITPPAGEVLHLAVPGFYSSGQALSQAGLSYLEQFAAYDPPTGGGNAPRVVADYSGITGKA